MVEAGVRPPRAYGILICCEAALYSWSFSSGPGPTWWEAPAYVTTESRWFCTVLQDLDTPESFLGARSRGGNSKSERGMLVHHPTFRQQETGRWCW